MSNSRIVSLIAALAGVISAFVASAQAANLFSLVPQKYAWITIALPIVSLFIVGFSERIQGGASVPEVRADAEAQDRKDAAISRAGNSNTLKCVAVPLLALALLLQGCGGSTVIKAFRAALESSQPLISSLVAAHVITDTQGAAAVQDFKDGADIALTLDANFKAAKGQADEKALKLSASVTAMRGWRAIINRRNFQVSPRLTQAADIADGILSSLVVFYSESGPMKASAKSRATVLSVSDEKELQERLKVQVDQLKQVLSLNNP
jgi:hypothetical protein